MSALGDEWQLGDDGRRFRYASRVLLFDPAGRLLLARSHDQDNPDRSWWFTIGGGREPGESARAAALRELGEETGIDLDPSLLIGPIGSRAAVFDFVAESVRQYEEFFAAWLTTTPELDTSGWTELEQDLLDGFHWWSLEELQNTREQLYPEGLAHLVATLVGGWDGQAVDLNDVPDPT